MSLALALIVNIALMVALLAGLAHAMSLPRKLKPHRPFTAAELKLVQLEREAEQRIAA